VLVRISTICQGLSMTLQGYLLTTDDHDERIGEAYDRGDVLASATFASGPWVNMAKLRPGPVHEQRALAVNLCAGLTPAQCQLIFGGGPSPDSNPSRTIPPEDALVAFVHLVYKPGLARRLARHLMEQELEGFTRLVSHRGACFIELVDAEDERLLRRLDDLLDHSSVVSADIGLTSRALMRTSREAG
jgi:hypothetical protein